MVALKPEYLLLACAGLLAVSFIAFGKLFHPPGEPTGPYNPWPYIRTKRFLRAKKHFELADEKCRELGERLLLTERIFFFAVAVLSLIALSIIVFVKP